MTENYNFELFQLTTSAPSESFTSTTSLLTSMPEVEVSKKDIDSDDDYLPSSASNRVVQFVEADDDEEMDIDADIEVITQPSPPTVPRATMSTTSSATATCRPTSIDESTTAKSWPSLDKIGKNETEGRRKVSGLSSIIVPDDMMIMNVTVKTNVAIDLDDASPRIVTKNPDVDLEAIISNVTNREKSNDYEYDYSEASLPPSLPNVRFEMKRLKNLKNFEMKSGLNKLMKFVKKCVSHLIRHNELFNRTQFNISWDQNFLFCMLII